MIIINSLSIQIELQESHLICSILAGSAHRAYIYIYFFLALNRNDSETLILGTKVKYGFLAPQNSSTWHSRCTHLIVCILASMVPINFQEVPKGKI